jgi:signal transduction histidine kinase
MRSYVDQVASIARQGRFCGGSGTHFSKATIVGVVVLFAALFGILTQPKGLLSAFWPANAVLLGIMLRYPSLATGAGWTAAVVGYFAADLLTGSDWLKTFLLTAGNLAGVLAGYFLFIRLGVEDRMLRRPSSMLSLSLVATVAALAAGLVGAVANPILFDGRALEGFFFWSISELVNYVAVLPVMLTVRVERPLIWWNRVKAMHLDMRRAMPLIAFIFSLIIGIYVDGPGALAFPVPSLLWCALTYSLATTSLLTLSFAMWALLAIATGFLTLSVSFEAARMSYQTEFYLISLRLGVMLVALAPLTVATVMATRNGLLREAADARAAAEEAMAARSLMLATMAHELRSPLQIISGYANLIAEQISGPVGNPRYIEDAKLIDTASKHLTTLVDDLLDTAQVEAGKNDFAPAPVSSKDLVEQSLRLVRGMAIQRGVTLVMESGDWPCVCVDSRAIKQVLINVLSNAVKFSPQGASVRVMGESGGDRLTLRVKDAGKGISEEDLARLGRPYAQAADAKSRRQGTGLGLALSTQLVEQHGGRLRLDSVLGTGTTVIFDLPLVKDNRVA